MKYLKYSNVSKDDIIILTDKEYASCWEAWKLGEVASIRRLGVDLPRKPHLPCGVPFRLRGYSHLYLTSNGMVGALHNKNLWLLAGHGNLGDFCDDRDTAEWQIQDTFEMTAEEIAERYGLVNLDDAVAANRIGSFQVRCIFDRS